MLNQDDKDLSIEFKSENTGQNIIITEEDFEKWQIRVKEIDKIIHELSQERAAIERVMRVLPAIRVLKAKSTNGDTDAS